MVFNSSAAFCKFVDDLLQSFLGIGNFLVDFHLVAYQQHRFGAMFVGIGDLAGDRCVLRIGSPIEHAVRIVLLWLVADDDHRFALGIETCIIVVLELGSGNAVTGKHHRQIEF